MTQYHAGKYREAIAGLEKVQSYRWSKVCGLAHLYEANSYLALSELPKAAKRLSDSSSARIKGRSCVKSAC